MIDKSVSFNILRVSLAAVVTLMAATSVVASEKESAEMAEVSQTVPNAIEADLWTSKIVSMLLEGSEIYDNNDSYRGDLVDEVTRTGLGIYMWADRTLYFGGWDSDMQSGQGVYSMPKATHLRHSRNVASLWVTSHTMPPMAPSPAMMPRAV